MKYVVELEPDFDIPVEGARQIGRALADHLNHRNCLVRITVEPDTNAKATFEIDHKESKLLPRISSIKLVRKSAVGDVLGTTVVNLDGDH